jgi:hypothetical protein
MWLIERALRYVSAAQSAATEKVYVAAGTISARGADCALTAANRA